MVESTISLDQILEPLSGKPMDSGCGSCGSGEGSERCGNGLEKIYPTTAVRFGFMRHIGEFSHAPDLKFTCGAKVIIQTARGIEIGEQVSLTCSGCDKSVTRDQMKEWVKRCGDDSFEFGAGRILREATGADLADNARIQETSREKRAICQRVANDLKLKLKIIDLECLFGGERIIVFFRADQRVDFREMVKNLAGEFHTRIEMRQRGARDEARLLADFETCGREVCCKVFLKTLRPISMKMAKLQKATLDPSKVSGRCGRLKCCLRYEHVGYEELDAKLPKIGEQLRTEHGDGVVVNRQILTQLVQIRTEQGKVVTVVLEDVLKPGEKTASERQAEEQPAPVEEQKRSAGRSRGRRKPRGGGQPPARPKESSGSDPQTQAPPGRTPTKEGDSSPRAGGADHQGTAEGSEQKKKRRGRKRGPRRRGRKGGPGASGSPPASDSGKPPKGD